jgi:hypothetical protein
LRRHGFERGLAEAFIARREDEGCGAAAEVDELVEWDEAAYLDPGRHIMCMSAAGQHEAELRSVAAKLLEGLEQQLVVLVWPATGRIEQVVLFAFRTERCHATARNSRSARLKR